MTTDVAAVPGHAGYKQIVTQLRQQRVSAFPNRVVGVVSEADLLYKQAAPALPNGTIRLAWLLRQPSKASATTAAELMTKPAVTISPSATVTEAAQLMQDLRIKRLPVVDEEGRLAGIVSRADVLSLLGAVRYVEGVVGVRDRLSYPRHG
jgi:CBS domain-containing protein